MFERFRIKAALRAEIIDLRSQSLDPGALAQAELIFFEPAFLLVPRMKQERWTPDQAMVFMVTDVLQQAKESGYLAILRTESPSIYSALRAIHRRILMRAAADPELTTCVSRPGWAQTPFADEDETSTGKD
ncbi:hypothetical protein [Sphingomonas sp.]|uniref:hypothetical protein n=1 Tax=Sphingomonas sp. TaxID=28214 RepID=UPI003B3B42D5